MGSKKPAGKRHKAAPTNMEWKALEVVHPDAAGIDIGGSEHWVAVSPERDPEPVRCFGCFTADLREMARWLAAKGVCSVAIGRENSPDPPVAPAHFHTIKTRVEYRQQRLTLTATYRQQFNLKSAAAGGVSQCLRCSANSYCASHSDDYSATASFEVKRHLALDVSYSKSHLDTLANLWVEEPINISIVVSVPGYVSEYISDT